MSTDDHQPHAALPQPAKPNPFNPQPAPQPVQVPLPAQAHAPMQQPAVPQSVIQPDTSALTSQAASPVLPQPIPQSVPQATPPDPRMAVSIRGLVKRFGGKTAVDGLSLDIPAGSFYGLVGPNGAGKTTTLNMLTGLLVPDGGTAMILGRDVWSDVNAAKHAIGVMPQPTQIFDRLTGMQLLLYAGMLRGMKRDVATQRARDLLSAFDLVQAANTMVADYSAGMTKKICLASAMIHSPRILVLDEPFESVDPVSSANLKDLLIEYASTGGTVIISSHVMALVERMCTHVAVISAGQVRAAGTIEQVAAGQDLEERFLQLVGGRHAAAHIAWLDGGSETVTPQPVPQTVQQPQPTVQQPQPTVPPQPAQQQPAPQQPQGPRS